MAFQLAFERIHQVLKMKATGVLATQHFHDLDMALIALLVRQRIADKAAALRCLYDFSEITASAMPRTKAEARGSLPSIIGGQRVIVSPRTIAGSFVESFVQSQRLAGHQQLTVVGSLEEAYALLGLNAPQFDEIEAI